MPQPINDDIKIRLSSIGNASIDTPVSTQSGALVVPDKLMIQYGVQVIINRSENCIDVIVNMTYLSGADKLFSGNLTTRFEVLNLSAAITVRDGDSQFHIERDFLPTLINIAFSTTRGYFARELKDSILEQYPFPMIPMDTIQKRVSYQLI